jgi:hypothetical protein
MRQHLVFLLRTAGAEEAPRVVLAEDIYRIVWLDAEMVAECVKFAGLG